MRPPFCKYSSVATRKYVRPRGINACTRLTISSALTPLSAHPAANCTSVPRLPATVRVSRTRMSACGSELFFAVSAEWTVPLTSLDG
jgi:hypothetical protein